MPETRVSRTNPKQVADPCPLLFILLELAPVRLLCLRGGYLPDLGRAPPGSIRPITFTNKAANGRSYRALLGDRAKGVGYDLPLACVRILRTELPGLGRSGRFTIVDSDDQVKIMRKALKELDLNEKQYTPSGLLHTISAAKDNLRDPEEYAKTAFTFYETKVAQAYSLYQQKLREQDGMDFDDLIMETVVMFQNHPDVLQVPGTFQIYPCR